MHNLKIGDRIEYSSAAGVIRGEIYNIVLSNNTNNELVPWLYIKLSSISNNGVTKPATNTSRLCGTHQYLEMMKVVKLYNSDII